MAFYEKSRLGLEGYVYFCEKETSGDAFVSINSTTHEATESGSPTWELIGYERGFSYNEGKANVTVYEHYEVDHNKRGRDVEPTFSLSHLYQNMAKSLHKYKNKQDFYIKLLYKDDGGDTVGETVYFTECNLNSNKTDKPEEGSVTVSGDGVFKQVGYTPVS